MSNEKSDSDGIHALGWNIREKRDAGWGVANHAAGDCLVSINTGTLGTGGAALTVAAGDALLDGSITSIASTTVDIAVGSAEPRKDVIYLDGTGAVNVAQGTPEPTVPTGDTLAASERPAPPYMKNVGAVVLAVVLVPAQAATIDDTNLIHIRPRADQEFGATTAQEATADRHYTPTRAVSTVVWEDGSGFYRAAGPTGEIASGTSFGTVMQSALDATTGAVLLKAKVGVYPTDQTLVISDNATWLVGECRGWTQDGSWRGSVIQPTAALGSPLVRIGSPTNTVRRSGVKHLTLSGSNNVNRGIAAWTSGTTVAENVAALRATDANFAILGEPGNDLINCRAQYGSVGIDVDAGATKLENVRVTRFADKGVFWHGATTGPFLNNVHVWSNDAQTSTTSVGVHFQDTDFIKWDVGTVNTPNGDINIHFDAANQRVRGMLSNLLLNAEATASVNNHINLDGANPVNIRMTNIIADNSGDFARKDGTGTTVFNVAQAKIDQQAAELPDGIFLEPTNGVTGAAVPPRYGDLSGHTGLYPGMQAVDNGTNTTSLNPATCTWTGSAWSDPQGGTFT